MILSLVNRQTKIKSYCIQTIHFFCVFYGLKDFPLFLEQKKK